MNKSEIHHHVVLCCCFLSTTTTPKFTICRPVYASQSCWHDPPRCAATDGIAHCCRRRWLRSAPDHLDHQEEISQIFHGRFSCPQQSINCHESIINGREGGRGSLLGLFWPIKWLTNFAALQSHIYYFLVAHGNKTEKLLELLV